MLSWVEIKRKNILHNLRVFKGLVGEGAELVPVIKANAYGHGSKEIAKICLESGLVTWLAVAGLDEAFQLRLSRIASKILVLSFYELDPALIDKAIGVKIRFCLYTPEQARFLAARARKLGKKAYVHVKIDTGTSRVGVLPGPKTLRWVADLQRSPEFKLEGLWSHFSSSEENPKITQQQYDCFEQFNQELAQHHIAIPFRHMACSASILGFPQSHFNMARLGLGLYGLYPAVGLKKYADLRPVLSWHARVIQVKKLPAGVKISYGGTFTTKQPTILAILPVGYSDGYDRRFSNRAEVLIRGQRAAVLGRVCMNLTMIDVTAIKGVKAGDTVVLLGGHEKDRISVEELAALAGTINYEIVARINPLLPRVIT